MIWSPIYRWLTLAVPPGTPVIRRDQDGPRPAESFVTAKVIAEAREGEPSFGQLQPNGMVRVSQGAVLTVSIQTWGAAAYELARSIRDSLNRPSVRGALRMDYFSVVDVPSGPSNVPDILGTTWEERWVLDVRLRTGVCLYDQVGVIEVVEISGKVDEIETFDIVAVPGRGAAAGAFTFPALQIAGAATGGA